MSDRDAIEHCRAHAIRAQKLVEYLFHSADFQLVGERQEVLREKTEWEFEFLPAGRRVFLSSLEVGTEARVGFPYLVLMPDAKLYRGWLGEKYEIPDLGVGVTHGG